MVSKLLTNKIHFISISFIKHDFYLNLDDEKEITQQIKRQNINVDGR
jgi:hypothetical protein